MEYMFIVDLISALAVYMIMRTLENRLKAKYKDVLDFKSIIIPSYLILLGVINVFMKFDARLLQTHMFILYAALAIDMFTRMMDEHSPINSNKVVGALTFVLLLFAYMYFRLAPDYAEAASATVLLLTSTLSLGLFYYLSARITRTPQRTRPMKKSEIRKQRQKQAQK